tara:strand:- start:11838 stop:12851 length:1014 start_codon:yes stop_codon:yes gene_type:complete
MNFFHHLNENFVIFILYILYSILVIKYSIFFSKKLKIIDYPIDKRKIHKTETPLVGFFYFSFTFFVILTWNLISNNFSLSFIFSLIFGLFFNTLVGLIDDRSSISANSRLILIMIIFSISLSLSENLVIQAIETSLFQNTVILNSSFGFVFTIMCYMLLLNSLNLSDGINGLAILITTIWLSIISFYADGFIVKMNFFLIINLLIIFFFNYKSKVFLGSGGVNFLATYICFITVYTFNYSQYLSYEFIFLIFMIPGIDMMRVFCLRIFKGRNPFTPDKNHLHHYLINRLSLNKTLTIYFLLILIPLIIFINFNNLIFYLIALKCIFYFYLIKKLSFK